MLNQKGAWGVCECGCTSNDERYWFPAPKKGIYLLTISGGCIDCCAPPGVSVELIAQGKRSREWQEREWYIDGELRLWDWANGNKGACIVTGFEHHRFVEAMLPYLVGVNSKDLGDNGVIDKYGAGSLLDEMYEDSMFRPVLVPVHESEANQ